MWFSYSVVNLICNISLRLLQKAFVRTNARMNSFRINWLVFSVSLPVIVTLVFLNIHIISGLPTAFWLVLAAVVLGFYPAVNYLYFDVIRRNELSDVLPLFALVPILTALFGWLFLDQHPSSRALVGIVCIFASIYTLHLRHNTTLFGPFKSLATSRSARSMGAISFITAAAAIGDKFAIQRSSTSIYLALNSIGALLVLGIFDLVYSRHQSSQRGLMQELSHLPRHQWILLGTLGAVQLANQISGFAAVNAATNTSYTIAIRNLNIVITSLIALVLYHESTNRYKFLSYGLSAIGVVMIAL
jgi:drug/metabolite transporter (DMT)-like permease